MQPEAWKHLSRQKLGNLSITRNLEVAELGSWEFGGLGNSGVGELGSWGIGELGNWGLVKNVGKVLKC